jgi:putative transposase
MNYGFPSLAQLKLLLQEVYCVRFAPNCPQQNPIEDIWLQAKTWVRRFCALIPDFSHLKWMFEWLIRNTTFDFASLQMYGAFSKNQLGLLYALLTL